VTGFFGKVVTHGDFVSRRLPGELVAAWDDWLQRCIHASRQQLGADWLTHYLTSPVWRFALAPGVLGPQGWGGVMMPSVDRVGRHFPLLIAAPGNAPLLDWVHQQGPWYDTIDDLARSSLDADFSLERFDGAPELAMAGPIARGSAGAAGACLPLTTDMSAAVAHAALRGHSLWWTEGSPSIAASLLVCQGMPAPDAFSAMLDGSWTARGWSLDGV